LTALIPSNFVLEALSAPAQEVILAQIWGLSGATFPAPLNKLSARDSRNSIHITQQDLREP
jgi:hypothetical protein